jgi:putative nucleotidyltransferase with HDIG domain
MRFVTRAFAFSFIPVAALLGISFWALQSMVQQSVRDQLRSAMRDKQVSIARVRAKDEAQIARFVRFASENTALKAGLQILNSEPRSLDARHTVEDQLRELAGHIGFRLLSIANFKGVPAAWVVREHDQIDVPAVAPAAVVQGLTEYRGQLYQLISVPIDQGDDNLGFLTVGDRFDLGEFGTPMVMFHHGQIVRATETAATMEQISAALAPCAGQAECDIRLNGAAYLSIRMQDAAFGPGYLLRSLQNVDAAAAPVQAGLRRVFLTAAMGALVAAFLFSAGASRSMVRPLADVVSHLQKSEAAGLLMEVPSDYSRIVEIRDLIRGFNRAAASIRDARDGLTAAYVEFIGSLANALDARDRYTAGHSQRVSQVALSIARALGLSNEEQECVRVGALLHDIGKIGIPDAVLQKPGVLSDAEFAQIKQHPTIGCQILKGVNGFSPYLPAVEFHHENWDGSGYPRGLHGEETPLAARIVHVADAWDAMTTDRPYRKGFSPSRALAVIRINAGTQFDATIVEAFGSTLPPEWNEDYQAVLRLTNAVGKHGTPVMPPVGDDVMRQGRP